jgi:hypothetical protein
MYYTSRVNLVKQKIMPSVRDLLKWAQEARGRGLGGARLRKAAAAHESFERHATQGQVFLVPHFTCVPVRTCPIQIDDVPVPEQNRGGGRAKSSQSQKP